MGWSTTYIHHITADGSTKYGSCNGFPRRNMVGGSYVDGTISGSRGAICNVSTARIIASFS